jgi:DNA polymerase I-like protein with 3'-5' exonuclease and polymerase domains
MLTNAYINLEVREIEEHFVAEIRRAGGALPAYEGEERAAPRSRPQNMPTRHHPRCPPRYTTHPKQQALNMHLITTRAALAEYLALVNDGMCALDFETTSLRPADGKVRLVSLYNGQHGALVDFDPIPGGFRACASMFEKGQWIVFNAGFELRWFIDAGAPEVACRDVGYLRRAIMGGGQFALKQLISWDLGREMDKTEQASDWSNPDLTDRQLEYAYNDALETWDLYLHWYDRADQDHLRAWQMFDDMVPAVIEMEEAGMLLDTHRHERLVGQWARIQHMQVAEISETVGAEDVANIRSDAQWSDYFGRILPDHVVESWPRTEKTGQLSMQGEVLRSVAAQFEVSHPGNPLTSLLDALAAYKKVTKYISSFGDSLLQQACVSPDKRVRARFNIAAARTGRFSCSGPNLQQIPRDNELLGEATSVRSSFVAAEGNRLVSFDYSGIELRVLALLAGDEQLLADMVEGDVHSEVAAVIAGHPIDKTTPDGKQARTAAKGVSFGIIYGSGASGLAVNMRTSVEKAEEYIAFWADRYSNAFDYRNKMMAEASRTRYIRCVDGGTIYMGKKPELPQCANYPVQRAALSVMARALTRHKDTLDEVRSRGDHTRTKMISTIHDAIIDETLLADAGSCLSLMEQDMTDAYLDIFPAAPTERLVEGGVGTSWANLA